MDSSLLHAVALTRIKGLTQAAAMQLLRRYGTAEELWLARHDLPEQWARLMANTAEAEDRAGAELAFCEKHGIQVLPYGTPAYPTLLAAVEMDDTGSTRIGKYVFNHAFLIPGVIAITLCVILGFIFGGIML